MSRDERKLEDLVSSIVSRLNPDFGLKLWGGPPLGSPDGPILHFKQPESLAALLIRPSFERAAALFIEGDVEIENGTLFDLARRKTALSADAVRKSVGRLKLLEAFPALLRLARRAHTGELIPAGTDANRHGSSAGAIQFHYDLSNEFYQLFLDERMVYSCGYFDGWHDDIDKAQEDKLDHICRKLRLQPGERLLDIGCGWGAMLIHAASRYGVSGYGVTLSQRQYDLATERVRAAGLSDRVTIELKPFQEIEGPFDKISSIGMFEHVGFDHHAEYFSTASRLLRPGGLYLHHAITRHALRDLKAFHAGSVEYNALRKYIFPGGELDWIGHTETELEIAGFEVHDVENLRQHYARTCRLWAERLQARMTEASEMVGVEQSRLWYTYLAGCALAFEKDWCNIFQTVAAKRNAEGRWTVPATRRDLYPC